MPWTANSAYKYNSYMYYVLTRMQDETSVVHNDSIYRKGYPPASSTAVVGADLSFEYAARTLL